MTKFRYSRFGDSDWYRVVDAKTGKIEYALFSLRDAPKYSKYMEFVITSHTAGEVKERPNFALLLNILGYVFGAVLEITHELRGVKLCKIYSSDPLFHMVHLAFANKLGPDYEVKIYGNWIEILKKSGKSKPAGTKK